MAVMGVAVVVVGVGRVYSVLDSNYGFEEAGACPPGIHAAVPTAAWSDLLHLMQISPPPYQRRYRPVLHRLMPGCCSETYSNLLCRPADPS